MSDERDLAWQYREMDPHRIALLGSRHPGVNMALVARLAAAYAKLKKKAPSWYRPDLEFPVSISIEQASSEATARFKAALIPAKSILDLTGGLGIDSCYFAQGAESLTTLEMDPEIARVLSANFKALGLSNARVLNTSATEFLAQNQSSFDLVYADPARRDSQNGKVFHWSDCSPDILQLKDLVFKFSPKLLLKGAPMLDIELSARQLGHLKKVWVLEYEAEVREVLYLLDAETQSPSPYPVEVVVIEADGKARHSFSFFPEEEKQAMPSIGPLQTFLYEPSPGILKSGAFKTFGSRFGLNKLHPNTQLYTAEVLHENIPARRFRVEAICKYDAKEIRKHLPEGKANVAVRNFPDKAEIVRKKLGLQDGGNQYVFAATDATNRKVILVCSKI